MPDDAPSDPTRVLLTIEERSARLKELATDLSDRIQQFERWISKLPGRVEATCWIKDPDSNDPRDMAPVEFGLRLHRAGKNWIISYCYFSPAWGDMDLDWKPLVEAPVTVKIVGVGTFPKLLDAISSAQEKLATELTNARNEFDVFANRIGLDGKERP